MTNTAYWRCQSSADLATAQSYASPTFKGDKAWSAPQTFGSLNTSPWNGLSTSVLASITGDPQYIWCSSGVFCTCISTRAAASGVV